MVNLSANVSHDAGTDNLARRLRFMHDRTYGRGGHGRNAAVKGTGYDVASRDRLKPAFALLSAMMASADRHLDLRTLSTLRELCRAHDRQGSLFSGILNRGVANIFGPTFSLEPSTGDTALDDRIWSIVGPAMEADRCDTAGVLNFRNLCATALRAIWTDGDVALVKAGSGAVVAFEADQVVSPGGQAALAEGRRIVLGVELGRANQRLAYWIKSRRTAGDYGQPEPAGEPVRIGGRFVMFPAYRTRFNQTRGVPFLASVLNIYERLDAYLENESLAAVGNAMLAWKITREASADFPSSTAGAESNEDGATRDTFEQVQRMEPLSVFDLPPGEDVEAIDAKRPGNQFEPFTLLVCRLVGAGIGFPLELLLLDFSKTSYSSARASLDEARRNFRYWQGYCDEHICRPWYTWQIDLAIASGLLPADPRCYAYSAKWPSWNYVDPWRESQANQLQVDLRVKSRSDIIRESGRDPEDVWKEIAWEDEYMASLGVSPTPASPGIIAPSSDAPAGLAEPIVAPGDEEEVLT